MSILYLDQPTSLWVEIWNREIGHQPIRCLSEVEVIYVHFTEICPARYPNLKVVLCPCTGIGHLSNIPKSIKIMYLDDKRFLFRDIWSTAHWTLYHILTLLNFNHEDLSEKTVGIVGMGRIGQQLYKLLLPHRCKFIFNDISDRVPLEFPITPLDKLCKNSDIITLHVNENETTFNLINDEMFHKMESKAYIINSSRSSILCGPALLNAWEVGGLSGIALDVTETYNDKVKSELFRLNADTTQNVIIDKHSGGKTFKSSRDLTDKWLLEWYLKWR